MNEVVGIEIVLENCEVISIPKESIKYHHFTYTEVDGKLWSKTGKLTLRQLNNLEFITEYNNLPTPLDRLTACNDITQICFKYINGNEETLYIDWKDGGYWSSENDNQTTELLDNEILCFTFN